MVLGSMAPRRRWLLLGLAALAVVALIAAGAVVITRLTGDNKPGGAPVGRLADARRRSARRRPSPSGPPPGADITGPLNLLLVGVDTRVSVPGWEPHSDAVLVLHVPKGLDRAYLFSLPRDLLVDIPAFPKAGYKGGKTKLTHAMSYGSRVPGKPKQAEHRPGVRAAAQHGQRLHRAAHRRRRGAHLQRVRPAGRRPGRGGHLRRPAGRLAAPPTGRQVPGERAGRVHRAAAGLREGRAAPQRLAGAGLRAAALHHRRRLRPAASPAAADPGDDPQDPGRGPGPATGAGRPGGLRAGRHAGLRRAGAGSSTSRTPSVGCRRTGSRWSACPVPGVGKGSAYRGEQLTAEGRKFLTELRAGRADAYLAAHPKLVVKN